MATPTGLEPATSRVTVWYSTLLNYEAIYKIDFSLNLYVYIILKISIKIKLLMKNFCGFQGILAEPHNHKEVISLSHPMADRPRIELRLPVKVGRISNPLGYHYPTGPYIDRTMKSLPRCPGPILFEIAPRTFSLSVRRRRAGLMAIRAIYGDGLRCRSPHHPWCH